MSSSHFEGQCIKTQFYLTESVTLSGSSQHQVEDTGVVKCDVVQTHTSWTIPFHTFRVIFKCIIIWSKHVLVQIRSFGFRHSVLQLDDVGVQEKHTVFCVIVDFCRGINEIFRSSAMLLSENWYLPKFLDNLLGPSSRRLLRPLDF